MKKRLAGISILLLLLSLDMTFRATPVAACECPDLPTPQAALAQAVVVFSGRVRSVSSIPGHEDAALVTFAISSVWKGNPHSELRILGPPFCESEFQPGQSYLVYASYAPDSFVQYLGLGPDRFLNSTPCSRTMALARASLDLSVLGSGRKPQGELPSQLPGTGRTGQLDGAVLWLLLGYVLISLGKRLYKTSALHS